MLLRVKLREAGLRPDISEHDIRVDVGIEIPDAFPISPNGVREGGDRLSVAGVPTAAIVGGAALGSIAVDVHVGKLSIAALDVDNLGVLQMVTTVGKGCSVSLAWGLGVFH